MSAPDLQKLSADMQTRGSAFHHNGGSNPSLFQVIGERASGTNVVRKTIEKNLKLKRNDGLGWKHAFPAMTVIPQTMLVICLFRNAVDWSLSMHKRPWHAHPDLQRLPYSEFIRAPWHSLVDRVSDFDEIDDQLRPDAKNQLLQHDRHPITGEGFANLFDLRRHKMAAALGMRNRDCHFAWIRLESFQANPELTLTQLCEAFDITPKGGEYRGVFRRMGTRFRAKVDNRPDTPAEITTADRSFLRDNLDLQAEALLGYEY